MPINQNANNPSIASFGVRSLLAVMTSLNVKILVKCYYHDESLNSHCFRMLALGTGSLLLGKIFEKNRNNTSRIDLLSTMGVSLGGLYGFYMLCHMDSSAFKAQDRQEMAILYSIASTLLTLAMFFEAFGSRRLAVAEENVAPR